MSDCAATQPGGLLAVTGLDGAVVDQVCGEWGLALAIDNGPRACIVGGPLSALAQAEQHCLDLGARTQRLRIGVASHTPWLRAAAQAFGEVLAAVPCQRPQTVLFSDVTGARVGDGPTARALLAGQIAAPVRWHACMESLYARRVSCVLEIGPGRALARLWQAAHPEVPARSCDDFRSARAVVEWVLSREGC